MELIHVRLKEELDRLGLKSSAAAKAVGEADSQGLRDVLGGRKRLSADLLAALSVTGVDMAYVLTGQRADAVLTADERLLLDRYRASPSELRDAALRVLLGGDLPPKPPQGPRYTVDFGNAQINQAAAGNIVNKKGRKQE